MSKFKGHPSSITLEWYSQFTMVFLYTLVFVGKIIFFKRLSKVSIFRYKKGYGLNKKYKASFKILKNL